MPYGMAGRNFHGDPFLGSLFKTLGRVAGSVVGTVTGLPVAPAISRIFGKRKLPSIPGQAFPAGVPPGGAILTEAGKKKAMAAVAEVEGRKRRRMNVTNAKALRRAIRRQDGFVKLARRALKGSGYTIATRGSRRPKRDLPVHHEHVR